MGRTRAFFAPAKQNQKSNADKAKTASKAKDNKQSKTKQNKTPMLYTFQNQNDRWSNKRLKTPQNARTPAKFKCKLFVFWKSESRPSRRRLS
jgi:hypothetical protein